MRVVSVNIAEPKTLNYKGKEVETGIFKYPTSSIELGLENVVNDAIVDRKHHGGILRAVYAYSETHYHYWRKFYPKAPWRYGIFGENITIDDFDENEVHVGNQYQISDTIIEVTEPRLPCMKLGLVFDDQKIIKQFWNSTKSGVYFKVVKKGNIKAGDAVELIKECKSRPTIAEVYNNTRIKKGL